jgi:hypothetical protein
VPIKKAMLPEAIPTLPNFFDKTRLNGGEFDKYIYEIKFKQSGKTVRGMALDGYIHMVHPYLKSIKSEMIHYGHTTEKRPLSCVVKAIVTVSYRPNEDSDPIDITVEGLGDGDTTDVPTSGSLVRTVETRALNRAFARLLDTSKADLNNEFVGEEEYGSLVNQEVDDTPRNSHRTSPQDISARKDKERMEAELDADNTTVGKREPAGSEGEETESGSDDDDW